jgi:leader peptidase (prepilin peptidase) / N-methyltransferase
MRRRPLIAAVLGAAAFVAAGVALDQPALDLARLSIFGAALGGAVAVDLAEWRIPNRVVLPATALCAALSIAAGVRFEDLAVGVAMVAFLLVFALWRPESFGMGDVKLAFLVVLGLNGNAAQGLLFGLALAALLGALIITRNGRAAGKRALPLAPFVAAGCLVALLA